MESGIGDLTWSGSGTGNWPVLVYKKQGRFLLEARVCQRQCVCVHMGVVSGTVKR